MPRMFLLFGLLPLFAINSCWQGTTRSICATVLSEQGEVFFVDAGTTNSQTLNSKFKLCPGSVLRTTAAAKVNLQLVPGAVAQISSDSELKIEDLSLTKDGNETGEAIRERRAQLELRRGKMIVLFEGFAHFEIRTRDATIAVLPSCLFQLDVNQSRTRVTCVRGKLYAMSRDGQKGSIGGGYFREWPSNEAPVSASDDKQAQIDITTTVQTGRELVDLAAARRDQLPF
jgi:FecR protein